MSKVKITGHASGSGTITLTGPNTSSDRTITLPDATGTALMTDGSAASLTNIPAANITGTLPAISGASLTGIVGITEYDMWVLTTTLVGDANPLTSNLARCALSEFEHIGTGMSESSGVFTFPSTGKWVVDFQHKHESFANDYGQYSIEITTDNSSWTIRTYSQHGNDTGKRYSVGKSSILFDVTNTSTHKVRFSVTEANNSNKTSGSTTSTDTAFIFMKLGET